MDRVFVDRLVVEMVDGSSDAFILTAEPKRPFIFGLSFRLPGKQVAFDRLYTALNASDLSREVDVVV